MPFDLNLFTKFAIDATGWTCLSNNKLTRASHLLY
jgi:hypothetical protein